MNSITRHFVNKKKYYIGCLFILVFIVTLIRNVPTWVLGNAISHYSSEKVKLYNQTGTFWNGSGLLVANDPHTTHSAPLLLIDWKIKLGLKKFIAINFNIGDTQIAEVYLNSKGINLDNLNLSLSLSQVSQLSGVIKDLGLSGNMHLTASHLAIGKIFTGNFNIDFTDISSSLSPVNPLGNYQIDLDAATGNITVHTNGDSTLILNGSGNMNSLTLNAKIAPSKTEKMQQFITVMGIPKPDGSYEMKIF